MSLRGLRLNRGLTVVEIAEATDIEPSSIYHYERTGAMPREPKKAKALADFFGLKVTDLWPVDVTRDAASRDAA